MTALERVLEVAVYAYFFSIFRGTTVRTISVVALVAAALLHILLTRGRDFNLLRHPLLIALGVFLALTFVSVLYSPNAMLAFEEYSATMGMVAFGAVIVPYALRDERAFRRLLYVGALTAIILNYVQIKDILKEFTNTGEWLKDVTYHRSHATSLIFYLPFLLALAGLSSGRRALFLWMLAALQVVLLAATAGRAAGLGAAVGLTMWLWLQPDPDARRRFLVFCFASVGLMSAFVAYALVALDDSFIHDYFLRKTFFVADRIEWTWKPAIEMISHQPLSGYGYGYYLYPQLFDSYFPAVTASEKGDFIRQLGPHNYYLEVWLHSGLFALISMVFMFARYALTALRELRSSSSTLLYLLALATLVVFTEHFLVNAHFGPLGPTGLRPLGVVLGLMIAVSLVNGRKTLVQDHSAGVDSSARDLSRTRET